MKRIVVSIFLLLAALFISKPFAAESSRLYPTTGVESNYPDRQNYLVEPNQSGPPPLLAAGCPCDTPYPNPTISLVIIAAVAAWLTMASFIYGSHFIAALIAG